MVAAEGPTHRSRGRVSGDRRRYLAVHGPASREDISRWWAFLDPAPAQRRIESLGDEVATIEVAGRSLYALAKDVPLLSKAATVRSVRLLSAFDQYVVAATLHSEQLMPGPFKLRVHRAQGWLSPVLLVNGRMDGVWKYEKKGNRVLVTIEPFATVSRQVKVGAEAEAERIAAFLGGKLDLVWA